jgi:hypothetical protein
MPLLYRAVGGIAEGTKIRKGVFEVGNEVTFVKMRHVRRGKPNSPKNMISAQP